MPGEVLDRPNPPPCRSNLPSTLLELAVKLDTKNALSLDDVQALQEFRKAADYIAAAMIFLRDNVLLERDLTPEDIKPRLLGHWGTCPGLTLVYSHLNRVIEKYGTDMLFVIGPGEFPRHGAPAILATLWLEGSLAHFYPHQYSLDRKGLNNLITSFSTPGGFPSHINAQVPGSIHEGGELGYALSVAFGAVMDNKDLIVPVIVGDGEAETGPTATAWHSYKYIDPSESGAVLPIVHINGFKISERTIYGCMDDEELVALFTGYGYQVRFVEDLANIDHDLAASLDWAIAQIRHIQKSARDGTPIVKPRWPVILLRTPKGWGAPKKVHGQFVEGSFKSHQVPLPNAASDSEELELLQVWLRKYEPGTLFKENGSPSDLVVKSIPKDVSKRMGVIKEALATYKPLDIPSWTDLAMEKGQQASNMEVVGSLLDQVLQRNPYDMRIFSPDELESNKLESVLKHTGRNFQWDQYSRNQGGRVIEVLSEHTCQGMMQGYTLTGRTALFPSYESFLGIIHTMMVQYSKFRKIGRETAWRKDTASINYLETSTWARQEHNGHSHQNPSFIGAVLNLKPSAARVYLPPDANCCLSTIAHMLGSRNYTNLMVGSKQSTPVWLSPSEAEAHCKAGASVWKFASTEMGLHPDVVLCGIGTEVTFEVVAAADWLRKNVPEMRVRVVNVTDLMVLGAEGSHPHAIDDVGFEALFTADRNVHINYHGYVTELKGLLFGRRSLERVSIEGYREEGTTTTPFDMMLVNHVSRYHVAIQAVKGAVKWNQRVSMRLTELIAELLLKIKQCRGYILEHKKDPEGTYDLPKFGDGDSGKATVNWSGHGCF